MQGQEALLKEREGMAGKIEANHKGF